jgi:predicted membrane-bound spermidine synthase
MVQPLWKRLLSYFFEFHIESAPSDYNPHLYVSLKQGRYQLSTANAVYSYDDLYDNFSRSFHKIDLDQLNVESVLILGLGLGSIPFMLEKIFQKQYHYTMVEIDESVIYLAQKYVLDGLTSGKQIICADAHSFVMQCQEKFDLVCMDIFLDATIPTVFEDSEFLEALKNLVKPCGLLMYNRLASNDADIEKTNVFYHRTFQSVFPQGTYLDVGGNWMLLDKKQALK